MRKFKVLVMFLAIIVMAGCSNDDSSKPKSRVIIEVDGEPASSLTLMSGSPVNLKAVLLDPQGNEVEDYTTAWTCSQVYTYVYPSMIYKDIGAFSSPASKETVFTPADFGSNEGSMYITADCEGVRKRITVKNIHYVVVGIRTTGANSVLPGGSKIFYGTVSYSTLPNDEVNIKWTVSPSNAGYFVPEVSKPEEAVAFYAGMSEQMIEIKAGVGGQSQNFVMYIRN